MRFPGAGPGTPPERARKWRIFWSYLPDWVLTIFLWAIFYLIDKIDGYRRLFSITDTSLAHPYANPDRVPVWLLAIVCGLAPGLIMIAMSLFLRRSFWDAHSAVLGFILNLGLSVTITNVIKDGFRSFPSGHASFAWAGMWYFILYLCAKLRINNRRGYTWKSWILLIPLMCSTLIMISRTMDYRHHATDVIAGGLLGILTAWFGYRQYYPAIAAPQSYKPFSPRIQRESSLPTHTNPGLTKADTAGRPSTEHLSPGRYSPSGTNLHSGSNESAGGVPVTHGGTGPSGNKASSGYGQSYGSGQPGGQGYGNGYPPSHFAGGNAGAAGVPGAGGGGLHEELRVTRAQRDEEERRGVSSEAAETLAR